MSVSAFGVDDYRISKAQVVLPTPETSDEYRQMGAYNRALGQYHGKKERRATIASLGGLGVGYVGARYAMLRPRLMKPALGVTAAGLGTSLAGSGVGIYHDLKREEAIKQERKYNRTAKTMDRKAAEAALAKADTDEKKKKSVIPEAAAGTGAAYAGAGSVYHARRARKAVSLIPWAEQQAHTYSAGHPMKHVYEGTARRLANIATTSARAVPIYGIGAAALGTGALTLHARRKGTSLQKPQPPVFVRAGSTPAAPPRPELTSKRFIGTDIAKLSDETKRKAPEAAAETGAAAATGATGYQTFRYLNAAGAARKNLAEAAQHEHVDPMMHRYYTKVAETAGKVARKHIPRLGVAGGSAAVLGGTAIALNQRRKKPVAKYALPGDNAEAERARQRKKTGLGIAGVGYLAASRGKEVSPGAIDLLTRTPKTADEAETAAHAAKKLAREAKLTSLSGKAGAAGVGLGLLVAGEGFANDWRHRRVLPRAEKRAKKRIAEFKAKHRPAPTPAPSPEAPLTKSAFGLGDIEKSYDSERLRHNRQAAYTGTAAGGAVVAGAGAVHQGVKARKAHRESTRLAEEVAMDQANLGDLLRQQAQAQGSKKYAAPGHPQTSAPAPPGALNNPLPPGPGTGPAAHAAAPKGRPRRGPNARPQWEEAATAHENITNKGKLAAKLASQARKHGIRAGAAGTVATALGVGAVGVHRHDRRGGRSYGF